MGYNAQLKDGAIVYIVNKRLLGDTEILTDQDGREFVLNSSRKLVPLVSNTEAPPLATPETFEDLTGEGDPLTFSDLTTKNALDDIASLQEDADAGDEDAQEGLDLIEATLDADDTTPDAA